MYACTCILCAPVHAWSCVYILTSSSIRAGFSTGQLLLLYMYVCRSNELSVICSVLICVQGGGDLTVIPIVGDRGFRGEPGETGAKVQCCVYTYVEKWYNTVSAGSFARIKALLYTCSFASALWPTKLKSHTCMYISECGLVLPSCKVKL